MTRNLLIGKTATTLASLFCLIGLVGPTACVGEEEPTEVTREKTLQLVEAPLNCSGIKDCIEALRAYVPNTSNELLVFPAGTYEINAGTMAGLFPDGHNVLFELDGTDLHVDFTGVTFVIDNEILSQSPWKWVKNSNEVDSLMRFGGSNSTYSNLTIRYKNRGSFADGGRSIELTGNGNTLVDFDVRGGGLSVPYGFGALYGKDQDRLADVPVMDKHSLLKFVDAVNCKVSGGTFDHAGFGHIMYVNPDGFSDNNLIENVTIIGELRTTDDVRSHGVAGHDRYGNPFVVRYDGQKYWGDDLQASFDYCDDFVNPGLDQCQGRVTVGRIESGTTFSLTEGGIRAYPHAGRITINNTTIRGSRAGVAFAAGSAVTATGIDIAGVAGHGKTACDGAWGNTTAGDFDGMSLELPTDSTVTGASADPAHGPVLVISRLCTEQDPQTHALMDIRAENVRAEVEVKRPREGFHRPGEGLAMISGDDHQIVLWQRDPSEKLFTNEGTELKVKLGFQQDQTPCGTDRVRLCNFTSAPVELSTSVSNAQIFTFGTVSDNGTNNAVTTLDPANYRDHSSLPQWCKDHLPEHKHSGEVIRWNDPVSIAASSTAGLSPTTGYFGSRVLKQDGPASFDMIFAHGKDSPGRFYFRKPIRPQTSGVLKYGDAIVLASTTWSGYTSNCGWYGCRVLTADGVDEKEASLVHGYRAPTVVYVRPWNGKEEGELVEYGDEIVLSATPYGGYTCNCGWHGCRVLTQNGTSPVSFQHGAASPQTFFILPPPGVSATQVQYNDAVVLSVDGTGGCGGFGCSVLQPFPSNTRELTLASGGSNPPSFKVRAPVEPAGGTNAQSPEEDCVRFGDEVVVSLESKDYTDNCGWYGCRTLLQVPANPVDAQLNHGLGKPQSFLIETAEGQESLAGQCLTRGKKIVLSTGSHFATRDQNERLKFQPIGTTPTFFYVR